MRYIKAFIPGTDIEVEFDTDTRTLQYHRGLAQWEDCVDHTEYDDMTEINAENLDLNQLYINENAAVDTLKNWWTEYENCFKNYQSMINILELKPTNKQN